jgi:hypothetical protein
MGTDYYTCELCNTIINDCDGSMTSCGNCEARLCESCQNEMQTDHGTLGDELHPCWCIEAKEQWIGNPENQLRVADGDHSQCWRLSGGGSIGPCVFCTNCDPHSLTDERFIDWLVYQTHDKGESELRAAALCDLKRGIGCFSKRISVVDSDGRTSEPSTIPCSSSKRQRIS